jgi:endoglucanase
MGMIGCRPNVTDPSMKDTPEGAPCPATGAIDDGEDANNQILIQEGRGGYWYTYVDDTGSTIDPPAGATGGQFAWAQPGHNSQYAARMKGNISGASVVFAGMGANLLDPKGAYDGSKYGGISFWAKRGPGTTPKVRFKIPDAATDPDGGICSACYNDFGIDLKLNEEWTQYIIPFDALKQERGWGAPHPKGIDKSQMFALQWQVNDKSKAYDVWVDDLAFTGCEGGAGASQPAAATPPAAAPAAAPPAAASAAPAAAPAATAAPAK